MRAFSEAFRLVGTPAGELTGFEHLWRSASQAYAVAFGNIVNMLPKATAYTYETGSFVEQQRTTFVG